MEKDHAADLSNVVGDADARRGLMAGSPFAVGWTPAEAGGELLALQLFPGAPGRWWSAIGLTADYLGGCVARVASQPPEFEAVCARLANELIENAFKYRHPDHADPIEAIVRADDAGIALEVRQLATAEQAEALLRAVRQGLQSDQRTLFLERVGQADPAASGLGLWTLIHEPGTRIGWRFEPQRGDGVRISAWLLFPRS